MPFRAGDAVHVVRLGKGIVRDVRNAGRYLVEVKGRTVIVEAGQLEPLEARKPRRSSPPEAARPLFEDARSGRESRALDLHGKTVQEALEALDTYLNDALLDGDSAVRVIHGRSGGRIRAAVHARLRELPVVRSFRLDPQNAGVTIVVF